MSNSLGSFEEWQAAEIFRHEVRQWLAANVPADMERPPRTGRLSPEVQRWAVEFRRKLGAQGWLAASWPKEYGGGGLTNLHGSIVQEELRRRPLPPLQGSALVMPVLRAWGTEEQKRTLLARVLRGEVTVVHMFTEASAGTDLRAVSTRAERDGDVYVVNGQKDFITSRLKPDMMLTMLVIHPVADPERRHSMLVIDAEWPGVTIKPANLLVPGSEQTIYLNAVRVPVDRLIGEEGQAFEIAQAVLEMERGGIGISLEKQREVEWREKQYREALQN